MDGSAGVQGTVLDAIEAHQLVFDKYYACGPEKMLDACVMAYPENGYLSLKHVWAVVLVPVWDVHVK